MTWLLFLPIILPLTFSIFSLLVWRYTQAQKILSFLGSVLTLAFALLILERVWVNGVQSVQVAGWDAPFGITLVTDHFAAVMGVISSFMYFATVIYSGGDSTLTRNGKLFYPTLGVMIMGVNGVLFAGDLFNLYVWFEVMLIASFLLLNIDGHLGELRASVVYVTLSLIASGLLLTGVALLYGLTGSLNMADISVTLRSLPQKSLITGISMFFLTAFGLKAAMFPLFFWLPASYHTPPASVSAVFAALLTKVGVYALIRVFTLIFTQEVSYTHSLLLVLSGFTMLVGVLGAAIQKEVRKILSFHIISQIGYMIMGLALHTRLALMGAVIFILHNIIVKSNLFLISGIVHRYTGTYELVRLGGFYASHPVLAIFFILSAMSLAGLPPLTGFWGKYSLARAGVESGQYTVAAVSVVTGFLTLFSMSKIWEHVFWQPRPEDMKVGRVDLPVVLMYVTVGAFAALTLGFGIYADPLLELGFRSADDLLKSASYVKAVLAGRIGGGG